MMPYYARLRTETCPGESYSMRTHDLGRACGVDEHRDGFWRSTCWPRRSGQQQRTTLKRIVLARHERQRVASHQHCLAKGPALGFPLLMSLLLRS